MFDSKKVGETIRDLRKEKNYTQEELGKKIGHTKSSLSKIETGEASPTLETLVMLARILGVNIGYILGDTIEKEDHYLAVIESFLDRFFQITTAKDYITAGYDKNIDSNDPVLSLLVETTNPLVLQMDQEMEDFIRRVVEIRKLKEKIDEKTYQNEILIALRKLNKSKPGKKINSYCFASIQDIAEAIDKAAEIEKTGLQSLEDVK